MTLSQQYDQQKEEKADRFRESDAVDEVLNDIQRLRDSTTGDFGETLEDLIEQVEEYVHYDESLEYILRQIPDKVKSLLV